MTAKLSTFFTVAAIACFSTNSSAGACDNASFRSFYDVVSHPGNDEPNFVAYDKTPDNYPGAFQQYCLAPGNGQCIDNYGKRFRIIATTAPTTKFSAAVCGKPRQTNYWYDYEHRAFLTNGSVVSYYPGLRFQYRDSSGTWQTMQDSNTGNLASWTFSPNTAQKYRWKWSSNTPRQYRIVVDQSMRFDEFDLIMDW